MLFTSVPLLWFTVVGWEGIGQGCGTSRAGTRRRGNSSFPALILSSLSSDFQHKRPGLCSLWLQDYITSLPSQLHFHTLLWLLNIILCSYSGPWLYHCLSFCFSATVPFPQAGSLLSSEAACFILIYSAGVHPAGPLSVLLAWVWLIVSLSVPGLLFPWALVTWCLFSLSLHSGVLWVLAF